MTVSTPDVPPTGDRGLREEAQDVFLRRPITAADVDREVARLRT